MAPCQELRPKEGRSNIPEDIPKRKRTIVPTTLDEIIDSTRARVRELLPRRDAVEHAASEARDPPGFEAALLGGEVAVIAEVKRRSPSEGAIAEGLRPKALASAYAKGGAAAISVLTEPEFFGGSVDDLVAVHEAVALPVLRKDFIIDPVQIFEARAAGASAVLLIVRALEDEELAELHGVAVGLGLGVLVEAHTEVEVDRALGMGARMVGVNSRDLDTFVVDVPRILPMLRALPSDVIAVAESGLRARAAVERVAEAGADAILVGTHLAGHVTPETALRTFVGVPTVVRTGARR